MPRALSSYVLRCYAQRREEHWEAFCIDLCLAAQGDSYADAKAKLEAQMLDYVYEALTVDREFADQLLSRHAPFKQIATYYLYRLLGIGGFLPAGRLFTEAIPLIPQKPLHA